MPVRARSRSSISAITCRPERLMVFRSSSSGSMPSRVNPPSRANAGGSSMSVRSIRSRTSARSSSSVMKLRRSGAWTSVSTVRMRGTAARDWRSDTRSRGPAVPSAARATSRSRSCTDLSVSRNLPRSVERKARSSTASSRSRMRSSAQSGRRSQARSSRPAITVTVRSISCSSDPFSAPSLPVSTSRCFRVIGSTMRQSAEALKVTCRTCARSAFCVPRR